MTWKSGSWKEKKNQSPVRQTTSARKSGTHANRTMSITQENHGSATDRSYGSQHAGGQ